MASPNKISTRIRFIILDMTKRLVVLGLLGTTIDRGTGTRRWEGWRPSISVCQHEEMLVDRFELLHPRGFTSLAETVRDDIRHISPETEVRLVIDPTTDPWDFEEVYTSLHDFAPLVPFDTDAEDYLVHITTGSHVAQICLFLLTESRHIPGTTPADKSTDRHERSRPRQRFRSSISICRSTTDRHQVRAR